MPFVLAYGSKAVLPVEVPLHTHRLTTSHEELNNAARREALDLLPSVRRDALLCEALYKLCIAQLHDRMIKLHLIHVGDFVLRRTEAMACAGEYDKLTANWEDLYKVTAQIPSTYRLETTDENPVPHT